MEYIKITYLNDGMREISILSEDELFSYLDSEAEPTNDKRQKVAIYKIGDCMIDWS